MEESVSHNSILEPSVKAGIQSIFPPGTSYFPFRLALANVFFSLQVKSVINRKFPMILVVIVHFTQLYLKLSVCPGCLLENVQCRSTRCMCGAGM